MDSKHKKVFKQFAEEAEKELEEGLKQMYLYGSVAKNEERENSDIDVFAVVKNKSDLEKLRDIAYDIGVLENEIVINVIGRTEKEFKGFNSSSFLKNIQSEGTKYA